MNIDAQIYAPTASCLISKEICVCWTRFYRPIRDGYFRILPEVIDRRRGTKGSRPLGTRLDGFGVLKVAQQSWLLLYAFFPPLFFRFSCLIFFSFWTSSRLHFGGKVFRKAFRILGLDERKSGWVVEQDFHGTFQVNVIWLQCYIGLLTAWAALTRIHLNVTLHS